MAEYRATITDLRDELDVDSSELSDARAETLLTRAHSLVENRPVTDSEAHLADLEVLVAAHFAYPRITGTGSGQAVSSVRHGQAEISYESDTLGPGEYASPYWDQAILVAPALAKEAFDIGSW